MWVGIGVGIGRNRFATGIFNAYALRVTADGGITEAGQCVDAVTGILLNASLLLIPSGYKGGKLYAEIPTNGNGDLTWTRGSDAFRTNASGVLQRMPWNLLQQSETFSNAYWTKLNATISADTTTAPNGTLTADTLNVTANAFSGFFASLSGSTTNYNVSIYAKKNTKNWLYFVDIQGTSARAWFDLNNGVLGTVASGYTATITNVGDGWYLCTLSNNNAQSLSYYQLGLSDANNSNTPTSSGSAFIWGAQLVQGTTAQTYLPTTDRLGFPRLDYTYGSCPAVLLEPQRTNLALQSESFDSASWVKTRSSVTANTITSPDGTSNADTFAGNGVSGSRFLSVTSAFATTSGVSYTISIFAKKNTNNFLQIDVSGGAFGSDAYGNFDLNSGVVGSIGSGVNATITNVGNGWYRCTITKSASTTSTAPLYLALITASNSPTFETNTLSTSVYLWGAQAEQGAYPTTYIPTTSATATRVADSFSRNNIYTNGLITSSGGTWFVELRGNLNYVRDSGGFGISLANNNTTYDFGFLILTNAGGAQRISILKRVSGIGTSIYTTTTDTTKIAIKWNGSTADVFANGTKVVTATSFTTTQMELLTANILDTPKFIQQMALFPTPLSDTDCTTITSI